MQTFGYALGEVLHPSDHQPQFLLFGFFVNLGPGLGSQSLQALLGLLDTRLELAFLEQAILIGIDQPGDATFGLPDPCLELLEAIPSYAFLAGRQPAPVLLLDALRIRQQRADVFPNRLLQQVGPNLPVPAHPLATKPVRIRPGAAVIGIAALLALAGRQADRLAVVGIPALLAHQQALQQMPSAPFALPTAPTVLGQLLLDGAKEILANDRRHGNVDPLITGNIVR